MELFSGLLIFAGLSLVAMAIGDLARAIRGLFKDELKVRGLR